MRDDIITVDDLALEALAEEYVTSPPAGLRRRLLEEAHQVEDGERLRARAVRWRLVGAVAATLAVVVGGLALDGMGRLARLRTALDRTTVAYEAASARLTDRERTLTAMQAALDAQAAVLRVVGGPRMLTAALDPSERVRGSGSVHLDPATGAGAVVLAGVDAPADDRVYELWAIRGDAPPEPAGLLAAASGGVYVGRLDGMPRPDTVTAFAVSIEPAGGSPTPTGPVVLVGPVRS